MASGRLSSGSATAVLEPIELQPVRTKQDGPSLSSKQAPSIGGRSLGSDTARLQLNDQDKDRNETLPSPTTSTEELEVWNRPRVNMYRTFATFWAFIVMGMNDASYGPLIPYLEEYYDLSYNVVALVFLSPFVGYNLAALLNNTIHMKLGQRGVAFCGPFLHLIAYIINCTHPPYPLLVISFSLAGLGNGFEDSAWNAWIGAMTNANEVLGFLHGFYGLGGVISPLIATTMITKANLPWYTWYYVMVSLTVRQTGRFCLRFGRSGSPLSS